MCKIPKFILVEFHKLSGCVSHLFIKKLAGRTTERINCTPNNEEKYMSSSMEMIIFDRFIDKDKNDESIQVKRVLRFRPY